MRGLLIGVVGGTELRIHPSCFVLAIGLVAFRAAVRSPEATLWDAACWALVAEIALVLSVLHMELGRRTALASVGNASREIRLTPLGGIQRTARTPDGIRANLASAFGGVPASLVAAATVAIVRQLVLRARPGTPCLDALLAMNLALAALQLLPLYPLGLGRFVANHRALHGVGPIALTQGAIATKVVSVALALLSLPFHPWLALPLLFLYLYAAEEQSVHALGTARITGRFGQEY